MITVFRTKGTQLITDYLEDEKNKTTWYVVETKWPNLKGLQLLQIVPGLGVIIKHFDVTQHKIGKY